MAINTDDQAINEAKATRGGGRKTAKSAPKSVDTGAGANQLQQKLDDARESVAVGVESYIVAGGVALALQRIASGNFGASSAAAFDVLDGFSASVLGLEADNNYQILGSAEEPKKMLASADVVDVA